MDVPDLSYQQLEKLIDEWILNERNRNIAKRRLLDGVCYEPLSREFKLSVRQVKNIVYKVEDKIFSHI